MSFQALCKRDHRYFGLWKPYFVLAHHASFIRWGTWEAKLFWVSPKCLNTLAIWDLIKACIATLRPGPLVTRRIDQPKACVSSRCRNWLPASSLRPGWLCWQLCYHSTPSCHHPSLRRVQDLRQDLGTKANLSEWRASQEKTLQGSSVSHGMLYCGDRRGIG